MTRWCLALLLLFSPGFAPAVNGEPIRLAALMPAPNLAPVPVVPRVRPATPPDDMHPVRRTLEQNPIHDPLNPEYGRLQRIDEATRHMPRDALGFPDWMAALRAGLIAPRAGMSAADKMNVLDLDVVMKNTKEMPHVVFPHRAHTLWLDCSNCHPAPFQPVAGTNPVSMGEIFRGKYCGMCHDRVAFISFYSCYRCHRGAQDASIPKR